MTHHQTSHHQQINVTGQIHVKT